MRDVVFKGKTIQGEWVCGIYLDKNHIGVFHDDTELEDCSVDVIQVIPETVGQFIGKTDKNNKKVFENDIVKAIITYPQYEEVIGKIVYLEKDFFQYKLKDKDGFCYKLNYVFNSFEVIGNMYDNPKLLGSEDL